jgi:phospholipase C
MERFFRRQNRLARALQREIHETTRAGKCIHPTMNRRTFLKTTGAVAAGSPLLERVSAMSEIPDIQHVIVVMMENRSFDHLLGWLPNANGKQAGLTFPNKSGGLNQTFELAPDFTGCAYPDPDHSYSGGRVEVDGGKMDGFLMPASNGLNAIGYYREQDLPFRAALARNYTTCDNYFPVDPGPHVSQPDLPARRRDRPAG